MRSRFARLVIPMLLMLVSAACASGPQAQPEVAQATTAAPATATSAPAASATAAASATPQPTSGPAVPRTPLSAVSRGTFWEVNCTAGTVTLLWLDNSDETGYRVYRNGNVIADQPADHVNYVDSISPAMGEVAYEIRAYNEVGESEPLRTAKVSCQ